MTLYTTLIDVDRLHALTPDDVLIVDCRFNLADPAAGASAYAAGHIPGARYASLDLDLSDLQQRVKGLGRHPLPDESAFSSLLSRWAWRPGMQVVSYDANGGALAAARLWWLLRLVGIQGAAVLDGGYQAWVEAGLPLTSEVPEPSNVSDVQLRYDVTQMRSHAQLQQALDTSSVVLFDARLAPRYRGDQEPIDTAAGHVPGARNRPFADNLQANGRFKPQALLRSEFLALMGAHGPQQVVHMCGSGVTACHNLLAMEHAGLHGSRLYPPSWSGWISDATRPVAKGSE